MVIECDVLVVGAGPAGSSAARAAAEAGAKTIFIDKKKEIGVPVQCAEAIGEYLIPFLPFTIPEEFLKWKIDGLSFWTEDITIKRKGGSWTGYAIDRDSFDNWLANNAIRAGAKLHLETELIDLEFGENYRVTKAIVEIGDGVKEIEPKVVIAADGVDSIMLDLLGLKKEKKGSTGEIKSFEMHNLRLDNPHYDQLFMGDFAPGAYGYIFPKSKNTANVGTGFLFHQKSLDRCYEEFLEIPKVKRQIKNAICIKEKTGRVPFCYLTDKWVYGNVLLAGDVANQNFKPLIEGFLPAIVCGDLAGKRVAKYLTGKAVLDSYPQDIENKLGFLIKNSDILLNIAYDLLQSEEKKEMLLTLGMNTNIFSYKKIEKLKKENYETLKQKLDCWNNSKIRQALTYLSETSLFLLQMKAHTFFSRFSTGKDTNNTLPP
jgi:digeranylgeranylglycerophospholipid reductase